MKPILLIFLLSPIFCFGQNDDAMFVQDNAAFNDNNNSYVKNTCKEFLNKNPNSKHKVQALYYLGRAYQNEKNNDSAILYFNTALSITENEKLYDNYKHDCAYDIADIYMSKKNYDKALEYLDKAEHKFPFRHFCGNAYASYYIDMAMCYSQCYKGKGDYKKAIEQLIPEMMPNGLANNEELVDSLYALYLHIHTKDEIKNEFTNAANTLTITEKTKKEDVFPSATATVNIFGEKIKFTDGMGFMTSKSDTITDSSLKKQAVESFKNARIYKLATK
jgi:tetratricopeptide (TPR) repeat protein